MNVDFLQHSLNTKSKTSPLAKSNIQNSQRATLIQENTWTNRNLTDLKGTIHSDEEFNDNDNQYENLNSNLNHVSSITSLPTLSQLQTDIKEKKTQNMKTITS